ncbi:methylated-DNA--[protein]-cysteine S-methyltransferase [Wenzhouxiangella sp. AB-CW3]|uniref:methylated-DNA--[protein]-cysteine S-methyltransferase n=1 Tax=Wenzhouxiangella sp. AB-CW3 TaxID=2771012 RepID=UPI00168BC6A0|nr:methylated-DNA--[protein]-cysteine S-methyltransferase [Wenzhouxiangella sp. AB-CW3]QOC22167.1 methylated-DNA--[protein]-cysteine S-methyltransferase [Wenzhouxiangella sp. AB-CW3]
MNDYQRIESAIAFIDNGFRRQPSVAEVAAHVGLSVSQFHRVFRRWAGITPQQFLAYVTASHARRLLAESTSVLESAWASGLSGSGRLHDLFVRLDGVTPGDIGRQGRGLILRHGVHDSPFGDCFLAISQRGVCALGFPGEEGPDADLAALEAQWPEASLVHDKDATARVLADIMAGLAGRNPSRLRLAVRGTNFQIRIWEALLRIPPGQVVSYGQLAAATGCPGAARAVGSAVAANPVPLLIPCHRVIRGTGAFGQYSGGVLRKRAILAWEAAHCVDR